LLIDFLCFACQVYIDGQRCPSGAIAGDVYTHAGGSLHSFACPLVVCGLADAWL
jgi:hypothetical protein